MMMMMPKGPENNHNDVKNRASCFSTYGTIENVRNKSLFNNTPLLQMFEN
jgi:hypothetical protein